MSALKSILRQNVLAALDAEEPVPEGRSGVRRLVNRGFAAGTATRILDHKTSVGIDIIEQLAEALGVEPWRLLLDPKKQKTQTTLKKATSADAEDDESRVLLRQLAKLPKNQKLALATLVAALATNGTARKSSISAVATGPEPDLFPESDA